MAQILPIRFQEHLQVGAEVLGVGGEGVGGAAGRSFRRSGSARPGRVGSLRVAGGSEGRLPCGRSWRRARLSPAGGKG